MDANWRNIFRDAALAELGEELPRAAERDYFSMYTSSAPFLIRDQAIADPTLLEGPATFVVPVSDPVDQLAKGLVQTNLPEDQRRVNDRQIGYLEQLKASGAITQPFNWGLFFNADSRFPELSGLAGAISGSFWLLLVCFLISFPAGIAAAIYLEEFAPKNRFTDLIEININNLAAVPSVVFGLLGLAVFLGWFGLPRSAPLVGGMVLALMTLPTIIIVNAFITATPDSMLQPSTALPTQIFIWADSPERGFVARTSAAIIVLLGFLVLMNGIAIFLRQRFERRW
jgi:phosphate transport system permease protein